MSEEESEDARWTVRGVSRSVRDIANRAAAARKMTVGEWLCETIVRYVRSEGSGVSQGADGLLHAEAARRLDEIERRLAALEEKTQTGLFGRLVGKG